jgi:hypothetical protein
MCMSRRTQNGDRSGSPAVIAEGAVLASPSSVAVSDDCGLARFTSTQSPLMIPAGSNRWTAFQPFDTNGEGGSNMR